MKSNSRIILVLYRYLENPDVWFSPALPCPEVLVSTYQEFIYSEWDSSYCFVEGSTEEQAFREEVLRLGITCRRVRYGAWKPKAIEAFPYYRLGPRDETLGLRIGADGFERQKECDVSFGYRNAEENGCALGKRQLKKLQLYAPHLLKKKDMYGIGHDFDMARMEGNPSFIISRRLRDALVEHAVTGAEIVPVLSGKRSWSAEQLRYDHVSKDQEDEAPCFQLTVTARPRRPLPLPGEPKELWQCHVCDHGGYERVTPDWPRIDASHFSDVDLQAVGRVRTPSGRLVQSVIDARELIASARLIRILHEGKFTGFNGGVLKGQKFEPLLFDFDGATAGDHQDYGP